MLKFLIPTMSQGKLLLPAALLGVALVTTSGAQAQDASSGSETQSNQMRGAEKQGVGIGDVLDPDSDDDGLLDTVETGAPPTDATRTTASDGDGDGSNQRKKMKKLKPSEGKPLEPMDETDTCPTLPCP